MSAPFRMKIARPLDPVKAAYENAIAGAALEIGNLASRTLYPQVASLCLRDIAPHCPSPGLIIQSLLTAAPFSVRVYRMGILFGVMPLTSAQTFAPLETLRAMDSVRSRIVRALVGDLGWSDAAHRAERTALVLKALVAARLGGAPCA